MLSCCVMGLGRGIVVLAAMYAYSGQRIKRRVPITIYEPHGKMPGGEL